MLIDFNGIPNKYEDPDGYLSCLKKLSHPDCPKCHGDGEITIWQAQPTKAAPDYKIPIGIELCECVGAKEANSSAGGAGFGEPA
jgi:hypothetical protein